MVNPKRFYTYAYLREDRTPYYIGKGQGERIYQKNNKEVRRPKDKSKIIYLKQNLTEEEAFEHEKYMIAVFGRKDLGTGILRNKTDGGEGVSGAVPWNKGKTGIYSEETKRKMSILKKEKYCGENNPNYGKELSQETREKISKANKGKKRTKEQRKHLSNVFSGTGNPFYGKKHSQEAKNKIGEKHRGKTCSEEQKQIVSSHHNKLLRFISPSGEIVEEVTTLRMFCKKYGLQHSALSKVLKGEFKQHKGWKNV